MKRPAFCALGALLLGACASNSPAPSETIGSSQPSSAESVAPAEASSVSSSVAAQSRSALTFDSNFAFDIRPMSPLAPLQKRIGVPGSRRGLNTYHWDGAESSSLDVEVSGDNVRRASVTTPDGSRLTIDPETAGANVTTASRSAATAITQSALAAVSHWAQVWSAGDVDSYLACYTADFHAAGVNRSQWVALRRQRLQAAHSISVTVTDPQVEAIGDTRVRVHFQQKYASSTHRDVTRKTLELWLLEGHWRIVGETSD